MFLYIYCKSAKIKNLIIPFLLSLGGIIEGEFTFMIGIYKITSVVGKIYIGQSTNIQKRFLQYSKLFNCANQTKLLNSLKKYGIENHVFEIICECDLNELNEKERYYQDVFCVIGKNGLNCKLTKTKDRSGSHSEETKRKISESNKKVVRTEKQKETLRTNFLGRKHSEASIQKMRDNNARANLGKTVSNETRTKLRNSNTRPNSKLVLNMFTGIFYNSILEACLSTNKKYCYIKMNINGRNKTNKTDFKLV